MKDLFSVPAPIISMIVVGMIVGAITGCCSPRSNDLKMKRTVPVEQYSTTVNEMSKQIELNNRYEAYDVDHHVYGDNVTITVYARELDTSSCYRKSVIKLQRENLTLKKKITQLEDELKKLKGAEDVKVSK